MENKARRFVVGDTVIITKRTYWYDVGAIGTVRGVRSYMCDVQFKAGSFSSNPHSDNTWPVPHCEMEHATPLHLFLAGVDDV